MIPLKPFYFMRHGQTEFNKENKYMGSLDIPLNSTGERQAHDALETFKDLSIDRIITSPLQRAYKTAEIIADYYALPLELSPLFVEANWGEMEGKIKTDNTPFEQWRQGLNFKNGESFKNVKHRVKSGLIDALTHDKTPLFFRMVGIIGHCLNC